VITLLEGLKIDMVPKTNEKSEVATRCFASDGKALKNRKRENVPKYLERKSSESK